MKYFSMQYPTFNCIKYPSDKCNSIQLIININLLSFEIVYFIETNDNVLFSQMRKLFNT